MMVAKMVYILAASQQGKVLHAGMVLLTSMVLQGAGEGGVRCAMACGAETQLAADILINLPQCLGEPAGGLPDLHALFHPVFSAPSRTQ
jgi:hypothetical protein